MDLPLLKLVLQIALAVLGLLTIMLVLLHKGRGGGLSDMFGGGVSSSASASGVRGSGRALSGARPARAAAARRSR